MGGVSASPSYIHTVSIGSPSTKSINLTNSTNSPSTTSTTSPVVPNPHKLGLIISIYYLGSIIGAFLLGQLADHIGRINATCIAASLALAGGTLQSSAHNAAWIMGARVVTGMGTGGLMAAVPVYIAEISPASHRGGFLGYVFVANYLGISIAYWLDFGLAYIDHGNSAFRWRFLLAFQCLPALLLLAGIKFLPDSPRYYASLGKYQLGREVLEHMRGGEGPDVEKEFMEICVVTRGIKPSSPIQFVRILIGKATEAPHLGRRAWLCLWLQIMASWTGITAVTAYSPVLLKQAGYTSVTQNGLAGGLNTIGIVGTIISAQVVDRFGRRKCLIWGAFALFMVNAIAASLFEVTRHDIKEATSIAPAAVLMLSLFNLCYAATWGTVAFLIPTEIFPSEMRAQGNGFGITGWAIGVGCTTLVNPIMFANLESRTYFLFAGLNLLWMPIIFVFYPETADRSLESIDAMFSTNSPLYIKMEAVYRTTGNDEGLPTRMHMSKDNSKIIEASLAVEMTS
ncbi:MFS sugar transporter [Sclerotinia borealis F-4128]|uniref:MFS sugar transporter n=1 Tax=Sclerotinia borealis (strain F-4128) TaxID=1432307 RepID=W9CAS3_SCLBF|nr:MFS sugar transporter [Sclerotinia borealis F-4128]